MYDQIVANNFSTLCKKWVENRRFYFCILWLSRAKILTWVSEAISEKQNKTQWLVSVVYSICRRAWIYCLTDNVPKFFNIYKENGKVDKSLSFILFKDIPNRWRKKSVLLFESKTKSEEIITTKKLNQKLIKNSFASYLLCWYIQHSSHFWEGHALSLISSWWSTECLLAKPLSIIFESLYDQKSQNQLTDPQTFAALHSDFQV